MDKLKKFFPLSYKVDNTPASLVKTIVFYVLIHIATFVVVVPLGAISGALILVGIGILLAPIVCLLGMAASAYCYAGIILAIVEFVKLRDTKNGVIETVAEDITEE